MEPYLLAMCSVLVGEQKAMSLLQEMRELTKLNATGSGADLGITEIFVSRLDRLNDTCNIKFFLV